ncbi:F-box/LRR-repeat protein 14-like isoform X1 [Macrosteles quadrilineatus]|uniref:F-box/LRR-repeat protein 14-like isoform X1 n=3 Tax=Macrosteles quadrilineatus TaxID=74068 RepID=UPI0023E09A6B|nr:F-box/LRR-repeat protein 14-like isoform X1 [Macrosteles quadrilineatus]
MNRLIQIESVNPEEDHPMTENNVNFLPLEVIIHIMGFLQYPDRVVASQVCKIWYEASLHPKFINQEKVVIKKSPEAFSIFKNSSKSYFHLILIELEINHKLKGFWEKMLPSLKSLCFVNCDMYDKTFIEILLGCVNLESLVLDNCRELFMAGRLLESAADVRAVCTVLCQLKELNLNANRYLSDALLNRLMAVIPKLESISLEGCQMSYHAGLYKKYYPDRLTVDNSEYASETVLTFWNFFNFISKRVNVIKKVNLSRTLIDSNAISLLSELDQLELDELYVTSCEQLTNAAIHAVSQHQKHITVLDVSYCSRITDQSLLYICNDMAKLKKLAVRNCRAITDIGITQLKKLKHLEELDISQCEQVTNEGIKEGLCSEINLKVRKLYMEGLNTVTSPVIILMAKNLPELTHLNLSYCFNAVTDDSVQAIFQHQLKLRSLRLASCDSVTDAGLTGMGVSASADEADVAAVQETMSNVVISQPRPYISLRSKAEEEIIKDANRKKAVQKMCEAQLIHSSNIGHSLVRLKGLQDLDLRCCNKITDVSLKYSFRFLELQHLNLSQCQQITDVGLASVGENNPSIDTLNLSHCYNIADGGVVAITRGLRRLKYLDIKGCNQLTDASVSAIVNHCGQLRYLDISQCTKMSEKGVEMLNKLHLQTLYSGRDMSGASAPSAPPLPRF